MLTGKSTEAIILLNLGGPGTLQEIKPFLFDLFMDRAIIPLPLEGRMRRPFARFLAWRRTKRVSERYQLIGGGSPLVRLTELQAQNLSRHLGMNGHSCAVCCAMRYGRPGIEDIILQLPPAINRIVAIPLFPQYCRATTGTSLAEIRRCVTIHRPSAQLFSVESFWEKKAYLSAVSQRIGMCLSRMSHQESDQPVVLFTAHSVPASFPRTGDPYVHQIEQTCESLVRAASISPDNWRLGWQSQAGPMKWIGPTSEDVVRDLADSGHRSLLVVPLSFVSDHLETLYDIDIVLKQVAQDCGIQHFERIPCFNGDDDFVALLAELVCDAIHQDN